MCITPAILATDEADFKAKLFAKGVHDRAEFFHVDVLDGSMFDAVSWCDPEIIGSWEDVPPLELHLMVKDPLSHALAFRRNVRAAKKAIIHTEIERDIGKILRQISAMDFAVGLAVNPETPVDRALAYQSSIEELLIMGVNPGSMGRAFLGEPILAKIRRARSFFPSLPIAIDGGVNKTRIKILKESGVDRMVAGSAIWKYEEPGKSFSDLLDCATMSP